MKRNISPLDRMDDWMRMLKTTLLPLILPLLLCLLMSLLMSSWAVAGGQEKAALTLFEQANILHSRGEFQQAAEQYRDILRKYGVSPSLLYNLADSYAAAGQVGPAVLNYERALRLAPGDADIQGNLAQVRKDAGLYQDDQPLYRRWAEMLGADQWLMIAGCALLCLGISALFVTAATAGPGQGKRTLLRWLMTGSLVVVLLTLPPAVFRYQDWKIGVVLAEDARLVISPFADATPAGDIKAGRLLRPKRAHGDYVLVKTENGKSGWLARDSFALLTDTPGK